MDNAEIILQFKEAVRGGEHWYIALLEAIGRWPEAEETFHDRKYRYLVGGEAFDWLLLAERLYDEVDGLLPEDEKEALLFRGRAPIDVPAARFRKLIGLSKYRQLLNYFYGVTVEEALIQVVLEEVRKSKWAAGYYEEQDYLAEVYRRIYLDTPQEMLRRFRKERKFPQRLSMSLAESKEFTYWRFKYRLTVCDKARIASDTRKALDWLKSRGAGYLPGELDELGLSSVT